MIHGYFCDIHETKHTNDFFQKWSALTFRSKPTATGDPKPVRCPRGRGLGVEFAGGGLIQVLTWILLFTFSTCAEKFQSIWHKHSVNSCWLNYSYNMTQENIQEVDALRPVACIILSVVHILKVVQSFFSPNLNLNWTRLDFAFLSLILLCFSSERYYVIVRHSSHSGKSLQNLGWSSNQV